VISAAPLGPRAYVIAAWTMTLPVSAAFGPWMRSKNGGLSMIIGAVSFCKTPSNEERPVRSWARQGYDWQLNADNSSGGRTRWSSCIPAFTSTRAQWVTQPQFLRRRNNGLSPHDSDPANPPSLRCARASFFGGEGEIRTRDRIAPMPVFKTGAFNRSATSPVLCKSITCCLH